MTDITVRADDGVIANRCPAFDHRIGLDGNARAEFRIRCDHRRRVDARRELNGLGREAEHNSLERLRRIRDADQRGADGLGELGRHEDGGGAGLAQLRHVSRVRVEGDLTRGRVGERSRPGYRLRPVTDQLARRERGEFLKSEFHTCFSRARFRRSSTRRYKLARIASS